ncbi:uncharacterized protein B0I36DRAFT_428962 [Microdochium trichocladiopsis]|uniref:Uncharacterized protein n=1 Tax=Microdochium trichocladiopsis TaxID=1682393 RepID=A0A9P9BSP0_9PEZI|nr:uncharacterized protein B0I36DRAFT_428962 [Microdochium trichocladiopsis]KAH7034652.1 hypothetical protein B0I36DRAFT_428962 [Microdochium trichocladiopsis]
MDGFEFANEWPGVGHESAGCSSALAWTQQIVSAVWSRPSLAWIAWGSSDVWLVGVGVVVPVEMSVCCAQSRLLPRADGSPPPPALNPGQAAPHGSRNSGWPIRAALRAGCLSHLDKILGLPDHGRRPQVKCIESFFSQERQECHVIRTLRKFPSTKERACATQGHPYGRVINLFSANPSAPLPTQNTRSTSS